MLRLKRGMFPVPRRETRVTSEQLPEFYGAVLELDNPSRDYILLLLFTGLRCTETRSLRWADIDFAEQLIRLPASATKANRKLDLPLSDYVRELLVARRRTGKVASDYVFPGNNGKHKYLTANIKGWKTIEKATGISVTAHDLRRTYASVAGEIELPQFAVSAILKS